MTYNVSSEVLKLVLTVFYDGCMLSAIRTHEVNGQQCEVKKAQSKSDEGLSRFGGGGRGTFCAVLK